MIKTPYLIAAATLALASVSASAQSFGKAEDAIKYRKATFVVTAAHFGRIGAMAQGKAPFDAKVAADSAELVATLSKLPWAGFGEGTDQGETRAKHEIWSQSAKFKEAADKFQAEAAKLAAAAKTGKEADVKTAFNATAGACKNCHDDFRSK